MTGVLTSTGYWDRYWGGRAAWGHGEKTIPTSKRERLRENQPWQYLHLELVALAMKSLVVCFGSSRKRIQSPSHPTHHCRIRLRIIHFPPRLHGPLVIFFFYLLLLLFFFNLNRHLFLPVLEGVQDEGAGRFSFFWSISPWLAEGCLLSVSSHSLSSVRVHHWYLCVSKFPLLIKIPVRLDSDLFLT